MAMRAMNSENERQIRRSSFEVESYDKLIASNKQLSEEVAEMRKHIQDAKSIGARNIDSRRKSSNLRTRASCPAAKTVGKKSLEELIERFIDHTSSNYKSHDMAIKSLESQLGQLAKQMSENHQGKFSSETLTLTEQENTAVVSTRSGRVLHGPEEKVKGEKSEEAEVERDEGVMEERARGPTRTRVVNTHTPELRKIPFPKALVKKNLDKQFSKFLEIFKKLHINIPFSEALEKMPIYAKLNLGEVTPTLISLQMADRSLKTRYGIIEDVVVKVDKFVFPVDFVILDMEEDSKVPLILGRLFLATGEAEIKVAKGTLTLKVGEDEVLFNIFDSLKHRADEEVFRCEVVDELVCEEFVRISIKDPLQTTIMEGLEIEDQNLERELDSLYHEVNATLSQLESVSSLTTKSIWKEELTRDEEIPIEEKSELKPLPSSLKYAYLEEGVIYPISDSEWVSPVQVVPKKGGITVVANENNESNAG
ncbi:uncharacterized protein LOC130712818 [Lotus japonicus]|uniref:uncharacterized protein LOC130712818 n=1 Tax=Lotus japonicus TaxID=34305 RepID=UPI00258F545C|nr:uncharacterized protein LOC130712818 [Lotus japonicus]